jgi:WD40 repeat protein
MNTPTIHRTAAEEQVPLDWKVGDLILGTYEVKEIFTGGGMAYVYRVHHRGWGMDLAVKCPRPELAGLEEIVENIVSEAETWVNLGLYPHIVCCYYIRVLGGIAHIFMEYADGGSLSDAIEQGRLYTGTPADVLERILDVGIQITWGLGYAHQKGLIHQDVKPANVLLTRDGIAKVTDFGMAQARARLQRYGSATDTGSQAFGHEGQSQDGYEAGGSAGIPQAPGTADGVGSSFEAGQEGTSILVNTTGMTPAYCSPEQAAAQPLSRRTDIFSWGAAMLEMFIGRRTWKSGPFALDHLEEYLCSGPVVSAIPLMPSSMVALLRRCLAFDPEERPRDIMSLALELQEIYQQETGERYPRPEPQIDTMLADSLTNRAISLLDLGRESDAVQHFNDAIKVDSTHSAALYNRGLYRWRSGQATDLEVLSVMQENRKVHPEKWEPLYFLSLLHLERGDVAEAGQLTQAASSRFGELPLLKQIAAVVNRTQQTGSSCLRTLTGVDDVIHTMAISPRGDIILTGGHEPSIKLWSAASGEALCSLTGHTHLVRSVKISPDGRHGLSGGWDTNICLWDLPSGTCLRILQGHTDYVQEVVFLPGGRQAISASTDRTLRIWDLVDGDCLGELVGHTDTVWSAAVSADGKRAVSASYDNTLRVWDLQAKTNTATIPWIKSCTSNLSLSADGKFVLLGAGDNRLWLIDLEKGEPVRSFSGHSGSINSVQITPNGSWAISGGLDSTLRLWDLSTGRCLRTFQGHTGSVNALSVCTNRALAVSGGSDRTIRLWRLGSGTRSPYITVLPRSAREIIDLSAEVEGVLAEASQKFEAGDFSGAADVIATARSKPELQQNPRLVKTWDQIGMKGVRKGLRSLWLSQSLAADRARVNAAALAASAPFVLSGGDDPAIVLWNLETGVRLRSFSGHTAGVNSLVFAPGDAAFLSGSKDGSLRLWKVETGECLRTLQGHTSQVNSVSFSPDGRLALSGSNDHSLRLWDLSTGRTVRQLNGHTHFVRSAAFTPDGRYAVSAGWDKTVRVWDLAHGDCRYVLTGHVEVIDAMALSPDGRSAVTGGLDNTLIFWNLEEGAPVETIESIPGRVQTLTYSADGRFLFSGSDEGVIQLWNTGAKRCIRTIKAHTDQVNCLRVSLNGTLLASASSDRLLKLWRLDWDYNFHNPVSVDQSLQGYLEAFLFQHAPAQTSSPGRTGRPNWTEADFQQLLVELGYRGYGGLAVKQVVDALRAQIKRLGM